MNKINSIVSKNEKVWVRYFDEKDNMVAIITSDKNRDYYFLYLLIDNKMTKSKHKNHNPIELEKYIKL